MAIPKQQKALVAGPECEPLVKIDQAIPSVPADYVLVKTSYVALNPTDWKRLNKTSTVPGAIAGCDFSGTVEEVGSAVTKKFAKGDRVMGFSHGLNKLRPDGGAFAEYVISKGDLLLRVPEGMPMDEAASLPLGLYTVGQGLYQGILQLAWPGQPVRDGEYVLIYGGSSATGALAIQFAKLSGYKVVTTCSPSNFDYVKSLGADAAFDHHDPDVGRKIREHTNNTLHLVYDTIALPQTAAVSGDALSSEPTANNRYMATLRVRPTRRSDQDVQSDCRIAYTIFNEDFVFGGKEIAAQPEDFEFAKRFGAVAEGLVAEGKVRAHRVSTEEHGGFDKIPEGWEAMRENKVSGQKLVYKV
ncbi:hypothetical protein AJ79_06697 [Helicocarpus griseus UAMH5409]|uniref:Enoyl reductase (ER) domain-containing protein n=1 Tax=Helicocarpus griseus UAMH5409 TaxID=1447875 RepID=A0A2B7XA43_9EURO|nr:hypothetical protein AJ79_06697 [Helicocarpus griseus UAMH5409]